jgi:probable F420-dependent oxidoreductase
MVELGAHFPQTEIGTDPIAIRDFVQAAEDLGYAHLLTYEHVLGAKIDRPDRSGRRWAYSLKDSFYDPFSLFSYIAAITQRISFITGILILLSGGRLRLGVGLGWNEVEYEALGENFHDRGKRLEEQVAVLRALWTQDVVQFTGRWHRIDDAGLNPLPVQRPIPIWMGGAADVVLRRIAAIGDGWILAGRPTAETAEGARKLHAYVREAGRDPAAVGIQGAVTLRDNTTPEDWKRDYDMWLEMGATHVHVNTGNAGLAFPAAHIDALRRMKDVLA